MTFQSTSCAACMIRKICITADLRLAAQFFSFNWHCFILLIHAAFTEFSRIDGSSENTFKRCPLMSCRGSQSIISY